MGLRLRQMRDEGAMQYDDMVIDIDAKITVLAYHKYRTVPIVAGLLRPARVGEAPNAARLVMCPSRPVLAFPF